MICTGGMSVDPDDKTPLAIKNTGARIVSYGAPVLPECHVLIGLLRPHGAGQEPQNRYYGTSGLRDVRKAHHLRSGAAARYGG